MKKIVILYSFSRRQMYICCIVIFAIVYIGFAVYSKSIDSVMASISQSIRGKTIVVDPGHGGDDPGAVHSDGTTEKSLTIQFARELRKCLAKEKAKVVLTRKGDEYLGRLNKEDNAVDFKTRDMAQRLKVIYQNKGEILVSIHVNFFSLSYPNGAQVFYYPYSEEGKRLAENIQTEILKFQPTNRRKEKAEDFYLLRNSKIPSVLVEVGFLSNPREKVLMASKDYQQQMAKAITKGIINYFTKPTEEKNHPVKNSFENG